MLLCGTAFLPRRITNHGTKLSTSPGSWEAREVDGQLKGDTREIEGGRETLQSWDIIFRSSIKTDIGGQHAERLFDLQLWQEVNSV